jgi:peptidoglycan hydrolase-like protein with peptidoglycan-binding domain
VFPFKSAAALLLSAVLFSPQAFASRVHRAPTSGQTHHSSNVKRRTSHRIRGQQSIDPQRATQIQQALIREHYMTGEPTGKWDAASVAAMQKFQADQGWQTKIMPDSRALKKLGLGPDYSTAINAKNSSFAAPRPTNTIPTEQTARFAAAAGVNQ